MAALKYEQISNTELWALLERKTGEQGLGHEFISAVEKVCGDALDLAQYIIHFFPTFTLHNDIHSANVCRWMFRLLGDWAESLTAHEAALLIMAACCHDVGMSVNDAQRRSMCSRSHPGWDDYFSRYLDDEEEYCRTGRISQRMLRNFVRLHHHERIGENLRASDWPHILTMKGIRREDLLALCCSHGRDLDRTRLRYQRGKYDLLMCAVLLRLADLLDYDAGRAPEALFRHMGLEEPETAETTRSAAEFDRNQAGAFDDYIEDGIIRYNAVFTSPQQEYEVQEYLDWVQKELEHCGDNLAQTPSHWQNLPLPYKISTENVVREGYAAGSFCMTMDQDRVIELLTGKHIYSDPGVFVRELLQNAIDAVLMRVRQDPAFTLEQGRIVIDTWPADTGDTWFRIRDNGTGMDEHIIRNYFLKVGRSYYTSDEFRAANRRASGGAYTAISRFGIGILSCFMDDPNHTELKVSTKRFRPRERNGIRLDVTGLHGHYYLAHEAQHPDYETSFLAMPSPDALHRGYRDEPGTTICVRTNLFRMGGIQSFREIVDKYVHFPEIRVEYNGPEGHKEYPTQQALMEAVRALNPGGVIREYVHEFPRELAERFKECFFVLDWKEEPALIMKYHPLDQASDSENMTGAAITMELRYPRTLRPDLISGGNTMPVELSFYFPDSDRLNLVVDWDKGISDLISKIPVTRSGEFRISFDLPVAGEGTVLEPPEQRCFDLIRQSLRPVNRTNGLIAYHGILASDSHPLYPMVSNLQSCAVLLLRDSFLPEVNVARDSVTSMPPEALCCLAMASCEIGLERTIGPWYERMRHDLTQRLLWDTIGLHPGWKEKLQQRWQKTPEDIYAVTRGELSDLMTICAAKQHHALSYDFDYDHYDNGQCFIFSASGGDPFPDFPPVFFVQPKDPDSPLGHLQPWCFNVYNQDHRFSRWLIQNRDALADNVPAVYNNLIRVMCCSADQYQLRDTINITLTRLREFEGNCFNIHEGLFLTEADMV